MKKLDKGLVIAKIIATLFLLAPYTFLIIMSLVFSIIKQEFLFDYFIPIEFGFLIAPGALILVVVSILQKKYYKINLLFSMVMVVTILVVFIVPELAGFDDESFSLRSFWFIFTMICLGIYDVTGLVMGVFSLVTLKPKKVWESKKQNDL